MALTKMRQAAKFFRFEDKKDKKYNVLVINKMSLSFLYYLSSHEMVSVAPNGARVGRQGLHSITGVALGCASLYPCLNHIAPNGAQCGSPSKL